MSLKAGPGRCEEASSLSRGTYIPCGAPAERMVKNRGEGPYRMCAPCAGHNVSNRGAEDVGPYEGPMGDIPAVLEPSELTAADLAAYEADASAPAADGENILAKITRTARELREARADVTQAEEVLKAKQARVRTIEEFTLPELMKEAGQEKLRTSDGYDLELKDTLHASIPPDKLAEAVDWLVAHNHASLVKRAMTLKFGKDENEKAQRALSVILEAGFTPEDKQSVHPQSLAAAIREMLAEGEDVPMALLGAHIRSTVKLTEPKQRK